MRTPAEARKHKPKMQAMRPRCASIHPVPMALHAGRSRTTYDRKGVAA
jgi:hypothetical protein